MATETTSTQVAPRDNAYWPDLALIADFVEEEDWLEQADQPIEDDSDYAVLYFIS